jgi:hypothetical protein
MFNPSVDEHGEGEAQKTVLFGGRNLTRSTGNSKGVTAAFREGILAELEPPD